MPFPTKPVPSVNAWLQQQQRKPTQFELDAMAPLSGLVNNPQDVQVLDSNSYLNAAMRMDNRGYRTVTLPSRQMIAPREPQMSYSTSPHEFVHIAQGQGLPSRDDMGFAWSALRDDPKRYDYGGIDGLESMMRQGKSVTDLNSEQQASALAEYAHLKRVADAYPGTLTEPSFRRKFLIYEQAYRQALAAKADLQKSQ